MAVRLNTKKRRAHGGRRGMGWKPGRGTRPRDFLLRAVMKPAAPPDRTFRYWNANGWWGDQGQTSQCVIYSWLHAIHDGPVSPSHARQTGIHWRKPIEEPTTLYQEAQRIDGTPVTQVDSGLSCDAGAQVMLRHGYVGEYRWAESVDEVVAYLITTGPMTIGAYWYDSMFEPDTKGRITMEGGIAGGHQWLMDGIYRPKQLIRCKNSWGRNWGRSGFFYITYAQVERMLNEGAEMCVFRELPSHLAADTP